MPPFYYDHVVRGYVIPNTSDWSPLFPMVIYDFVLRRTHRQMLYDNRTEVLVGFQDREALETRKRRILLLSILNHPDALRAHIHGIFADMNVDPVPALWENMTQSVITKSHSLAQEHDRTCGIIVTLDLEIRTEGDVYVTSGSTGSSEFMRQCLMESTFRISFDEIKYDDDVDYSCSICLDEFCAETDLIKTPCDHIFHKECIIRWLEKGKSCPLCRFKFN